MITFRQVIGFLETIADKHYEIKSFHNGFLDEVDVAKLGAGNYPILYSEPGPATIDKGVMTYSFTIYVLDMIREDMSDRQYTFSENLRIIQDVINEFKHSLYSTSWVDGQVVLETPITAEPFTARFDNILTGWSATISVQVNNTNNLCEVPVDPNS